ncbi:TPA: histidine kinase, partial [Legionella pneumophila]|nr:histidine kinase [Legionella pneumophila]
MPSMVLPKPSNAYTFAYYLTITFAMLTLILGLSVLIGWHFGIEFLIQFQSGSVAIVYNTALCFIVLSLAILFSLNCYYKSSLILSIIVFVFSGLGFSQHILGVNLGVDEIFFHHYHAFKNAYPGRMAANTAF